MAYPRWAKVQRIVVANVAAVIDILTNQNSTVIGTPQELAAQNGASLFSMYLPERFQPIAVASFSGNPRHIVSSLAVDTIFPTMTDGQVLYTYSRCN